MCTQDKIVMALPLQQRRSKDRQNRWKAVLRQTSLKKADQMLVFGATPISVSPFAVTSKLYNNGNHFQ